MPNLKPHILHVTRDLDDIFPEFLENRRREIAAIPEALKRGDFKQIRVWGHNMAGCGEGYCFPAVSEYGRILEAAALSSDVGAIERCVAKLSGLVNNIEIVYC